MKCEKEHLVDFSYFISLLSPLVFKYFNLTGFYYQVSEFSFETSCFYNVVVNPMVIAAARLAK